LNTFLLVASAVLAPVMVVVVVLCVAAGRRLKRTVDEVGRIW
jgi:hypothetical protein